jgi:hypothetical protein
VQLVLREPRLVGGDSALSGSSPIGDGRSGNRPTLRKPWAVPGATHDRLRPHQLAKTFVAANCVTRGAVPGAANAMHVTRSRKRLASRELPSRPRSKPTNDGATRRRDMFSGQLDTEHV